MCKEGLPEDAILDRSLFCCTAERRDPQLVRDGNWSGSLIRALVGCGRRSHGAISKLERRDEVEESRWSGVFGLIDADRWAVALQLICGCDITGGRFDIVDRSAASSVQLL